MARRVINLGTGPNTKTGDSARVGGDKVNLNFEEVYTALDVLSRVDIITENKGFSLVGNDLTINDGWEWLINNSLYTNPLAVLFEDIALSSAGKTRLVYVVPNDENSFTMLDGEEAVINPPHPYLPNGGMFVTFFEVSDTAIGDLNDTYDGEALGNKLDKGGFVGTAQDIVDNVEANFVKKMESQDFIANYGETTVIDHIDLTDDRSSISLIGSATDVKSVQVSGEFIRPGKPHYFKNRTGHDVTIWHLAGTGNIKYFFPNGLDLIVKPNEVIEFSTNANDSSAVRFEYVGNSVNISGKEDTSNKTDDETTSTTSSSKYFSVKGFWNAILLKLFVNAPAKATALVDADKILIGDSEDSNKTKTRTFSQLLATLGTRLLTYFQAKDNQVEISANSNVLNTWDGQTILFTANCTITVPSTLNNSLMFPFRTLAGVTVTWAITSPFTWETTPTATPEKKVGHFMRRGATNTILLDV